MTILENIKRLSCFTPQARWYYWSRFPLFWYWVNLKAGWVWYKYVNRMPWEDKLDWVGAIGYDKYLRTLETMVTKTGRNIYNEEIR